MNTYEFTLNVGNVSILSDNDLLDVSTSLYDGPCYDAYIGSIDEAMFVEFERKAESLEAAIAKAIKDVESNKDYKLVVESVEGDLVSLGEAAEATGIKKSTLAKYKKGTFGGGGFPAPARKVGKKDPVWRLWDIAEWLYSKDKVSSDTVQAAKTISLFNSALEARRFKASEEYQHIAASI